MDKKYKRLEELDEEGVVTLLEKWDLEEFVEFARERTLDGRKLFDVSEGIVKLWRPKANAKKFMTFIEDMKLNPKKYLENKDDNITTEKMDFKETTTTNIHTQNICDKQDIESQYQTVTHRRKDGDAQTHSMSTVEELIRRIVPAKSFLYRNQQKAERTPSYLPMDAGTPKKKKLFRLSSYEYPFFDIRARFSRQESSNDRGYYAMKRNSRYYTARSYKKSDSRTKYKTLSTPEEFSEKCPEDHFYEDLCYNEVDKDKDKPVEQRVVSVKPCIVKIQELFQSFKVPFFKKHEMLEDCPRHIESEKSSNIYENDSVANMYDSVHVIRPVEDEVNNQTKIPVEDYLEPVQLNKDYCDVNYKQKDDSLLGYILSIFENRFGIRRETNDDHPSEESEAESHKAESTPSEDAARKWPESRKSGGTNMADRPLPVPVENEPYYMNVDRAEAINLLKGQPDGTFILRPSSQPDHAYTLSVACSNAVHNVGVRRRPDGRLALGFPRRGEQSFASVTSLLRHHRKRRLLLVAGGDVIGATTLNETPHYYQSPSSIPVPIAN
ncbi:unnamed protein product [Spodoptera littoralis]|uniref:SH2 domain-containing protein n=1 Tax=Spodoptera littoralis TaxID=7109 RepID=A0A9P0I5X0_SPOLI|nr:unnamed protein product [Spodoptera littoralis]CAH1641659.1 unnamed protein product [Spodoptera littoralis]